MTDRNTISPVEDRGWLPTDFLDEVVPSTRPTPNDWLFRLDDGAHRCGAPDDDECPSFALVEGQIVEFSPRDDHPDSILTIRSDEDWSIAPKPPVGALLYVPWDMLAESPDDLVRQMKDSAAFDPGTETVRVYTWGEAVSLRFTTEDGPPRFVLPTQGGAA